MTLEYIISNLLRFVNEKKLFSEHNWDLWSDIPYFVLNSPAGKGHKRASSSSVQHSMRRPPKHAVFQKYSVCGSCCLSGLWGTDRLDFRHTPECLSPSEFLLVCSWFNSVSITLLFSLHHQLGYLIFSGFPNICSTANGIVADQLACLKLGYRLYYTILHYTGLCYAMLWTPNPE